MRKLAFEVSYDGTDYAGFQRQSRHRTIQCELERALSELTGESVVIHGSGRTDAGVHALGQVIHFTTNASIPTEKWPLAIKNYLPEDIIVRRAFEVAHDFHARYDAIGKLYRYQIDRGVVPNVFYRKYAYHYPHALQIDRMQAAIMHVIGTHDFSSFCASGTSVENKVRTIHEIAVTEDGDLLKLDFYGSGFLYNMVRILVGTLLQVGSGKIAADDMPDILAAKDRHRAGPTAPAHGLTLMKVEYPYPLLTDLYQK